MLNNHLLGLYEKALPSEWSWRKRLEVAKNMGFDYMEISIDESDQRIERLYWGAKQRSDLLNMINRLQMPIKSMCLSVHRRFPFGSADHETSRKAYELMERAIEFAGHLGIRVIQLAGYDVYYEPSTELSVKAFMEGLRWSADLAAKHQVMLAMEIMDTPLMNSITKHLAYEQAIRSPWYKLYPDLGNLSAWGNDVEAELTKGIESIVAVHIKDTKAVSDSFMGQFKCVPFGEGCVDFAKCFSTLEGLGYKGPYMIEMWSDPAKDDQKAVAEAVEFIRNQYYEGVKL